MDFGEVESIWGLIETQCAFIAPLNNNDFGFFFRVWNGFHRLMTA